MSDTQQRRVSWLFYFRFHSTNCQLNTDFLRPPLIIYHNHYLQYKASFPRFIFKHLWKAIISIASLFLQSLLRSEIPHKQEVSISFSAMLTPTTLYDPVRFFKDTKMGYVQKKSSPESLPLFSVYEKKNTMIHLMSPWRLCGLAHAPTCDLIGGNVSTSRGSVSASPWSRKMLYLVPPHNATIKHCCFIKLSLYGMGIFSKTKIHSVQKVLSYSR